MADLIDRQAAIDETWKEPTYTDPLNVLTEVRDRINALPSAQPEYEDAVSRKAVIDAIDKWKEACADNGHKETVSDIKLIRKDFIELPSVTPKQPGWIPWDSGRFPEESGTYTVTAYDGAKRRVTYAKYQKRLKRWELTGSRAYWQVLAWMPLPKPWEGGQDD